MKNLFIVALCALALATTAGTAQTAYENEPEIGTQQVACILGHEVGRA